MPGPISDSYKGPKGHMPIVPTWLDEAQKAPCAHTMRATGADGKTRCCDCGKVVKS